MSLQIIIPIVLQHLPIELLLISLLIGAYQIYFQHKSYSVLLTWLLALPVGISGVWGFVFHGFFPDLADKMIGWAYSPFEFEVAIANLGLGLLGILSFRASLGFRKAAVLFCTTFLWGAAAGHIYQMLVSHNFNPGNAGAIFWTDIFIPVCLLIGLRMSRA